MISVIMPVFNCADTVGQAIDSIMNQTYLDIELIVVDDGSTDDTLEVVADHPQFGGNFILERILHSGAATALNRCLEMAKGEYIARHDGDDYSHPKRFEKQLEYLEKKDGCRAIGTGMVLIDEYNIPFKFLRHPQWVDNIDLRDHWPCVAHPTVMFRANVFNDVGLYDETIDYCEDYDLWFRIAEFYGDGAIHNMDELLYTKRVNRLTNTAKGLKNGLIPLYNEMVLLKARIRDKKNEI